VTELEDMDALARVAEHHGKLILRVSAGNGRAYVVEDGSSAYRYTLRAPEPVAAMVWPHAAER
jgi:hypothetical protein